MRNLAFSTLILLAACSGQSAKRAFVGLVTPISGTCDPPAEAELTEQGSKIVFAPNSGTLALRGTRQADTLVATETLVGADKMPYTLIFRGTTHGVEVDGTYETARCRYAVSLHVTNL